MADEAEKKDETAVEEGGEKKKLPLWVIILVASQVVLVVVAVVVFKMMSSNAPKDDSHEESAPVEQKAPEHGAEKGGEHGKPAEHGAEKGGEHGKPAGEKANDPKALTGPQMKIDPFIVNLIDDGRGPRYLKVEMSFELEESSVQSEIESRISQIRDELLILLSSKRQTDIETTDGKRILKDEIFTRVNKVLATGRIKRIFFNEFVIQ